jgi:hypothetical protein
MGQRITGIQIDLSFLTCPQLFLKRSQTIAGARIAMEAVYLPSLALSLNHEEGAKN